MKLRQDLKEVAFRVGFAVLLFLGSMVVNAAFIGSSLLLDWLLGFAVDKETRVYEIVKTVLDILLLGVGLVVTIGGAVVVVRETWTSIVSFVSRTRSNE